MKKDTRNAVIVLMVITAGIVGLVFGNMMYLNWDREDWTPPDKDEIERRDPSLYLTVSAGVASVNLVIAFVLIFLYFQVYQEVKSDFSLGLILVMFSLLLYAVFSNPLIHSIFGFRAFGIGPFTWIPHVFALVAMSTLLYLSLK